jgi:hypothetical protein
MQYEMGTWDKLYILRHNVSNALDALEVSLSHNIGKENAGYFVTPLRETAQKMEEELEDDVDFKDFMIEKTDQFWKAYFHLKSLQGELRRYTDDDIPACVEVDIDSTWGLKCDKENVWQLIYNGEAMGESSSRVVWTSVTKDDANIATELLSQYVFDKMSDFLDGMMAKNEKGE